MKLLQRHRTLFGVVGGTLGVVIGIYSDDVRKSIKWIWEHMLIPSSVLLTLTVAVLVGATWHLRGVMERRRQIGRDIISQAFDIQVEDFEDDLPGDQAVIGRELHYLERATESKTLVVLLPGLGLDANDFRPYMNIAREHTAAITLFGFNAEETWDEKYRPVGLATHVQLVNGALNNLRRKYPQKRMVLVGFSMGADIMISLGDFWQAHPGRNPHASAMVLLDPNVNHSSMVVSGAFATMNPVDPLTELKGVAQIPKNMIEFQNMSEYLHKISKKNLLHIQRHAEDWWNYWEPEGRYDLFFQGIGRLYAMSPRVRVLFSVHYDQHFNEIVARAKRQNMSQIFGLHRKDHFELLNERVIAKEVATSLAPTPHPSALTKG